MDIEFPEVFQPLFEPDWRFIVAWGGRDGCKSWSFARALISLAHTRKLRILCTREFQTSIKDSVHRLLKDQIEALGLQGWFTITQKEIIGRTCGSEFLFKGLHNNYLEIKSTEGINICWVEEAQKVSHESWNVLIPTIRKQGSMIWVSFNPQEETDDTYSRFIPRCVTCRKVFDDSGVALEHHNDLPEHVMHLPPPDSKVFKTSYRDNPWTSQELTKAREHLKAIDPEGYAHVYEGDCMVISDAIIFKGRYVIHSFPLPDPLPRFYHGADFGFGPDPACLLRSYVTEEPEMVHPTNPSIKLPAGKHLWVDEESYGWGIEQDDLPKLYNQIPTAKRWPIKADSSRPETISHVKGKAFMISAAKKWQGSVEDGIHYLKQFVLIHVHERCKHFSTECRMYRFKVDRVTGQVLPIIIDAWNHGWDALRYSFDGMIHRRDLESWKNL